MQETIRLLLQLGITPKYRGHWLLLQAIQIMDQSYSQGPLSITRDIYPAVARTYGSTPASVDRNIRTAVDACWTTGDPELRRMIFPSGEKPGNFAFISALCLYLHLQRKGGLSE